MCMLISDVKLQKWTGTYAWNNECKSNYCCCYAGKLTVVASGSNLLFSSGARGCGSSTSSATFANPNSYSFSTTGHRGSPITYTLSSDSNTITVKNIGYSACGGSGQRTSVGTHLYPSLISFFIVLATMCILL
ncbi:unnamed protein product [Rotaria magnacalcarata]|uniref:Uncharacterized protein n=2 Tax=Rotaria magnacalcarata TaxID=392030 RepID=A0A816PX68_9BILA|nr:unnamed protein product [Rotaria magnacalcarata]CAF1402899.1 unnamed protein product [Rotaria magnacalcarata]CAF2053965.1 unnamed protein product [Rotaria magnacalcarata]CAF2063673.1 unnamed protein product [Rotaria magnacalcarata]CAF2064764.1 unnamed protein product [Rotaria magnacalcarata]